MPSFDPKGDFETVIDGSENVTLEVSGTANRVVLNAHRNQISTEEVEASNGETASDGRFCRSTSG
jgi:hypothetical protein